MKQNLQEWANANKPEEKMFWYKSFWNQIIFVRDKIAAIMCTSRKEYKNMVSVVSTHMSKSILCPVYLMEIPVHNVKIYMRYNYFNWNISVDSGVHIACDFLKCFSDKDYDYCYCEGMEEWKYGKYCDNNAKFTVCIHDDYDAYVFFKVLREYLGLKYNPENDK